MRESCVNSEAVLGRAPRDRVQEEFRRSLMAEDSSVTVGRAASSIPVAIAGFGGTRWIPVKDVFRKHTFVLEATHF